jgi:hypothetical protein
MKMNLEFPESKIIAAAILAAGARDGLGDSWDHVSEFYRVLDYMEEFERERRDVRPS